MSLHLIIGAAQLIVGTYFVCSGIDSLMARSFNIINTVEKYEPRHNADDDDEVELLRRRQNKKEREGIIVKTTKTVSIPPESNLPKQHHHRHDSAVDSGTTSDSS